MRLDNKLPRQQSLSGAVLYWVQCKQLHIAVEEQEQEQPCGSAGISTSACTAQQRLWRQVAARVAMLTPAAACRQP